MTEPSRWRLPVTLGLAAAGLTGTLGVLVQLARTPPPAPEATAAAAASGDPAPEVGSAEPAAEAPSAEPSAPPEPPRAGPPCTCARADSPLWAEGLPALAVLVAPREGVTPRPGKLDLDVAAVNDAARPLRDVRVVLTFWRRAASGKKLGVTDRGLFWSGDLAPGQAVRWRVRAPGTEYRVDASVTARLAADPALEPGAPASPFAPAPPEAFAPLAQAAMRPVRMHAATMLAYLRDPRALDAARDLGATTLEERARIARLERASAPIFACGVAARGDALAACVMNGSTEPGADLVVREVVAKGGGDGEGQGDGDAGVVPVHEGVLVTLPLEGGPAPAEVEVVRAGR
jgi:hypothetical protein